MEIDKLRKEIDKIDEEIVQLLKQRIEIVKQVGKFKKQNNLQVEDKEREKKVIDKLSENLDPEYVKELYQIIFKYSKKEQI